jgi:acyl-CoA dehydrogenase
MDLLLAETATRILADFAADPEALWPVLEENGLTRLWVSEADGGFDMSATDGFGLIRLAGAHAAPVPLAETLVASWLLSRAGLQVPMGQISVLMDGFQRGVPFGNEADHIVRVQGRAVALHGGGVNATIDAVGADPISASPQPGGMPQSQGELPSASGLYVAALARAAQMCGAMEATLDLTISFAEQREQFGRPLSKFQAIQHMLSEMGSEAAAASAAVDAAVMRMGAGDIPDLTAVAVAKYRAGRAAGTVAEHAHQIHGAIGYTEEYPLARLTRRLWQWREDFGGESYWAGELGRAALAGDRPLWPRLTAGNLLV